MNYSVVTTVFNDEEIIERFFCDILAQDVPPSEIIIADGGSIDNTKKIISQMQKRTDINISGLFGNRLNIAEGFNLAIKNANESIVMIAAVGNRYPKECFGEMLKMFRNENIDAVYTPVVGADNSEFSRLYNKAILRNMVKIPSNHGTMIKKSVVEEVGYFCESFKYAGEDLEFYERFKRMGKRSCCCEKTRIIWDVPVSYSEFARQTEVYLVGAMQSYANLPFIKKNARWIGSFLLSILSLIMVLFSHTRIIGTVGLGCIMLVNIVWGVKLSIKGCWLQNKYILLKVKYLVKNYRFFYSKNKITLNRRLS